MVLMKEVSLNYYYYYYYLKDTLLVKTTTGFLKQYKMPW